MFFSELILLFRTFQVTIGTNGLSFSLGHLEYRDSLWDEPEVRDGVIGGSIGFVVLVALIVAAVFIVRKIRRAEEPPPDTERMLRNHPAVNIYDRGGEMLLWMIDLISC